MIENKETGAAVEMPKYQSHKKVWALQIELSEKHEEGIELKFVESNIYANIVITDKEEISRFEKCLGDDKGYLVLYKGAYRSWSPTDAFEEGYSKLKSVGISNVSPKNKYFLSDFQVGVPPQNIDFYEMNEDGSKLDGTTLEEMLRVSIERLTDLDGRFPGDENKSALSSMVEALRMLNVRTENRKARGVEGKHEA